MKEDPGLASIHAATEHTRWLILNELATGPKTASNLARTMGKTPQFINWHANKLVDMGLATIEFVTPEEGGMTLKSFVLVPQEYIVRLGKRSATLTTKLL